MPLKIPYYEMDIPRLVTALADWLACLLYLRFLPPRYGGVKRAALYGGALAVPVQTAGRWGISARGRLFWRVLPGR